MSYIVVGLVMFAMLVSAGPGHAATVWIDTYGVGAGLDQSRYGVFGEQPRIVNGSLQISYSSEQYSLPSGVECTAPLSSAVPKDREIDISFLGGGTDMSNSLFVCYSIGLGRWLSMPSLPSQSSGNDRTGYMIRFIRHGDGTNEVKFYRNDEGWEKEIANDRTLPFNVISTLRRVFIQHRWDGHHRIQAWFDTGMMQARIWEFEDAEYLPDNDHRGLQVAAKGHAVVTTTLDVQTDTWIIRETPAADVFRSKPGREEKRTASPDDVAQAISKARKLQASNDLPGARVICKEILDASGDREDLLEMLARLELALGNTGIARKYLSRLLALQRDQKGGMSDLAVAGTLFELAKIYLNKSPVEAERLFEDCLSIRRKRLGAVHLDVAAVIRELAGIHTRQGRLELAERYYARALEITENILSSDHLEVAAIMDCMAEIYRQQGRFEMQEHFLERIIVILEKSPDTQSLALADNLQTLSFVYQKLGKMEKMLPALKRAVELKERELGPDHTEVAKGLANMAVIHQNRGDYAESEKLYKRALEIRRKKLGEWHIFVAGDLYNLGALYMTRGKNIEAVDALMESLEIFEKSLGAYHLQLVAPLQKLSRVYGRMGRSAAAAKIDERIRQIQAMNMAQ